ncbi:MAG: ATP-dependent DNA helicase [Bacilli bacterium]|nr:ATP-dependent DNA helicase [Bacilli bacterium]
MAKLNLSVHQLVDFVLRTGDIDNRIFNRSSMSEGTLLHALYQSKQNDNYLSEIPLEVTIMKDDIEIHIEGRADGIIKKSKNKYVIDEIKTTVADLDEFFKENEAWHLGQAELYGYMFCKQNKLDDIELRLTYISQKKHSTKLIKSYFYSYLELEQKVHSYLDEYLDFYHIVFSLMEARNHSLKDLAFPFPQFRKGQKELGKYSYAIASKGGELFVEAPTGIGKTMSTLYPFIKSLENDELSKIFYLTAKASGKENAHNATKILIDKGARLTSIVITAKDKICFCKGKGCNPDECPFTKGYYTKIASILKYSLLTYQDFDVSQIIEIAKTYEVCPFELELDLSLYSDVIICDYNYVFDPVSYMHRYFDEDSSHYLALIDEAHNLVDRSREMYSASIKEDEYLKAKKSVRKSSHRPLKNMMAKVTRYFNEIREDYQDGNTKLDFLSDTTVKLFTRFLEVMLDINKNYHEEMTNELLDFYLNVNRFMKILELSNDSFLFNVHKEEKLIDIEMHCLDASTYLKEVLYHLKGTICFSATLSPSDYYIETLGGKEDAPVLKLESPFPKENFLLLVAPKVSVKYKNREASYEVVRDYIKAFIKNKVGNYLVFFPSYEYLSRIRPLLENDDSYELIVQEKDMLEEEKINFINSFESNPNKTKLGLAIIGGSFSEGIDLVSDRLIGAVVVGIGMPKINYVSDHIAYYYKQRGYSGHNYAYLYPGMNKVMQAVGRVIRSETDKGAVLLIDERYMTNQYQDLFKKEWSNYEVVLSKEEVDEAISSFYSK